MYQIGDYVVYGSNGVCKVEAVGTMDMTGVAKDKLYYTLTPIYEKACKIYAPTQDAKLPMRPVISETEAWSLIKSIPDIEGLGIVDEKRREDAYKETLKKCDCREWVKVMKTLYQRKKTRLAEGKKVTSVDEKYLNMAEESLYGELAVPLKISKNNVEGLIVKYLDET